MSRSAISSGMGVLAMFKVWSISNAKTFFIGSLYHEIYVLRASQCDKPEIASY